MFTTARLSTNSFVEIPCRVDPSRARPCYHQGWMTLHSSFLRLLCFFGLCAWLSLQSASAPSVGAGNSQSANSKPVVHFTDIAQKTGLTAPVIFGGENTKKYIIETTGTGVAIFDYDNDGWPDIFVVNGTTLDALPTAKSPTSHLYRNNHDGTFTDVAVMAGCAYSDGGHEQAGMGVAVADYDCDGWFDIFKTNFADDTCNLYHNNGDGTFTDVTFASGVGVNNRYVAWGCAFIDYDNDGWQDILQVNGHVYPEIDNYHLDQTFKNPRLVYKNLGKGQFKDVSAEMGPGITERFSSRGAASRGSPARCPEFRIATASDR